MIIEEALFTLMAQDTGVNGIAEQRIYAVTIPQLEKDKTSYPVVLYTLASRERQQTHDGPTPLVKSQFTLDVLGQKNQYFVVKNLADKIRLAVNGKKVELAAIYGGHVKGVFLDNEQDDYVYDTVDQLSLYRVAMDFRILHGESLT